MLLILSEQMTGRVLLCFFIMPSQGLPLFLDVAIGETFGMAVNWMRGFLSVSGVERRFASVLVIA